MRSYIFISLICFGMTGFSANHFGERFDPTYTITRAGEGYYKEGCPKGGSQQKRLLKNLFDGPTSLSKLRESVEDEYTAHVLDNLWFDDYVRREGDEPSPCGIITRNTEKGAKDPSFSFKDDDGKLFKLLSRFDLSAITRDHAVCVKGPRHYSHVERVEYIKLTGYWDRKFCGVVEQGLAGGTKEDPKVHFQAFLKIEGLRVPLFAMREEVELDKLEAGREICFVGTVKTKDAARHKRSEDSIGIWGFVEI